MGMQPAESSVAVEIDESQRPILIARLPPNASADNFSKQLAQITKVAVARQSPFVLLIDATDQMERPNALHRKLTADEMLACFQKHPGLMRGLGVVVALSQGKSVITALSWMVSPPYPMQSFDSMIEAKLWASKLLGTNRRDLP